MVLFGYLLNNFKEIEIAYVQKLNEINKRSNHYSDKIKRLRSSDNGLSLQTLFISVLFFLR
jgi:hypothetical protein